MQAECSKNTGPISPTTATCATSRHKQLSLLPEGSPASRSVRPGSEEARRMTVTSGRQCLQLSKDVGPLGCLVKTCLESSTWNSTQCFLIWKPKATPQGRLLYRLVPRTPRTEGTGSGLWPTITAQDSENCGGPSQQRRNTRSLNAVVRIWPTPVANDATGSQYTYNQGNHKSISLKLPGAVRMWPTPKTPTGGGQTIRNTPGGGIRKLEDRVSQVEGYNTGSLNPTWVEWLMGFPTGWTDLDV